MKTQIKSLFYLLSLSTFILLTSCREESDENIFPEEETVLADSEIANLILRTTQKDGSEDDILDGSSCYSVELPVTITIEDIKILVETEEDFNKIEDVFEDLEEEIDDLEFIYPITLIAEDFTETIIENEDELEKLLDACEDDDNDEDDDEIECINFKYPFTVSLFDKDNELIETITFNNDKELYTFINDLTVEQIVNIGFPIMIINADQEEITINNLKELTKIIKEALDDDCDDDEDRLADTLTNSPLEVQKYKDDESNETKNYTGYAFDFAEDGTVAITKDGNDEATEGFWSMDDDDEIIFDFGEEEPLNKLNGEWNIKKILRTRIMLENRESSNKSKDQLFFQQIK